MRRKSGNFRDAAGYANYTRRVVLTRRRWILVGEKSHLFADEELMQEEDKDGYLYSTFFLACWLIIHVH